MSEESVTDPSPADEATAGRNPLGRWVPGVSGNPNGAPPATPERKEMRELAREKTPQAIEKILAIMNDPKSPRRVQLACARELLDRGWGKPTETQHISTDVLPYQGFVSEMDTARRIAYVLANAIEHRSALPHTPTGLEPANGSTS